MKIIIRLGHNYAYAMAAEMSWHMQCLWPDSTIGIKIKTKDIFSKNSIVSSSIICERDPQNSSQFVRQENKQPHLESRLFVKINRAISVARPSAILDCDAPESTDLSQHAKGRRILRANTRASRWSIPDRASSGTSSIKRKKMLKYYRVGANLSKY